MRIHVCKINIFYQWGEKFCPLEKWTLISIDKIIEKIDLECEAFLASQCHNFSFKKTKVCLKKAKKF